MVKKRTPTVNVWIVRKRQSDGYRYTTEAYEQVQLIRVTSGCLLVRGQEAVSLVPGRYALLREGGCFGLSCGGEGYAGVGVLAKAPCPEALRGVPLVGGGPDTGVHASRGGRPPNGAGAGERGRAVRLGRGHAVAGGVHGAGAAAAGGQRLGRGGAYGDGDQPGGGDPPAARAGRPAVELPAVEPPLPRPLRRGVVRVPCAAPRPRGRTPAARVRAGHDLDRARTRLRELAALRGGLPPRDGSYAPRPTGARPARRSGTALDRGAWPPDTRSPCRGSHAWVR